MKRRYEDLLAGREVAVSLINEPIDRLPLTARQIADRRWGMEGAKHEQDVSRRI
jgi:hypothetical protein